MPRTVDWGLKRHSRSNAPASNKARAQSQQLPRYQRLNLGWIRDDRTFAFAASALPGSRRIIAPLIETSRFPQRAHCADDCHILRPRLAQMVRNGRGRLCVLPFMRRQSYLPEAEPRHCVRCVRPTLQGYHPQTHADHPQPKPSTD